MKQLQCLKKCACVCMYTSNISMLKSILGGLYYYREQDHIEIGSGQQSVMVVHMHGRE